MINYGEDIKMNKAQLINWIYQLSDNYLSVNYDKDSGDIGYNLGFKSGINGLRNYIRKEIENKQKTNAKHLENISSNAFLFLQKQEDKICQSDFQYQHLSETMDYIIKYMIRKAEKSLSVVSAN